MGDDLKSSAVVWGGDQEPQHVDDSPPAYSGAEPETQTPTPNEEERPALPSRPVTTKTAPPREPYNPIQELSRWSQVPFSKYVLLEGVLSADKTTATTTHATFQTSHHALSTLITEQSQLPPLPTLRITGHHVDALQAQKLDFDITLPLHTLLDLQSTPVWRTSTPFQSSSGHPPPSSSSSGGTRFGKSRASSVLPHVDSAVSSFLREKSDRKSLTLVRSPSGIPTELLEGQVRTLLAALHYRGKLGVSFPVRQGRVVVQRRPTTAGLVGGWVRNVLGLSAQVDFEVGEVVWALREEDAGGLVRAWWSAWVPAVRDAVLARKRGVVGVEDWMVAMMGGREREVLKDWGVDYST